MKMISPSIDTLGTMMQAWTPARTGTRTITLTSISPIPLRLPFRDHRHGHESRLGRGWGGWWCTRPVVQGGK